MKIRSVVVVVAFLILWSASPIAAAGTPRTVHLASRTFTPEVGTTSWIQALGRLARTDQSRIHLLVQLDTIPTPAARASLSAAGLNLLAYVPDHTWIASCPAGDPAMVATLPGVVWAGELMVDDKLSGAVRAGLWGPWNLAPDQTVAVHVVLHRDEALDTGRILVQEAEGAITGEVIGIKTLVVELPLTKVRSLAASDAVQWIESVGPPLTAANDGSRAHSRIDLLQAAPYNLDGTGIDALVYDSGQAGDHVDFGSRLTHGDGDTVSDHSTHVAGTLGGDGSNSVNEGGTALQWGGMAPNVDLISYGTGYSGTGPIFYENVPDIEADFAAAQNTYGADLANCSLGSNVYLNYPGSCYLMGLYGAASELIDQIVRGGNSVVGVGDKYITSWAVGNERGWGASCGTYSIIAPPAAAKNPIHVGGSNTNDTTQYAHGSWGPTEDGRLKPIVTAGACQTDGDFGITSTDDNPLNAYTVMCGTSMATPAVSGGIALLLQHYRSVYSTTGNFWPSSAKVILMQTAVDQGNVGPDYQWGYGEVDMQAAADLITRQAFRQESLTNGAVDVFSFDVTSAASDVVVSLAWDDFEATLNANPTLINDLDLELLAPDGTTWQPWILDPDNPADAATRGPNTVDNQEQVLVPAASVVTGKWLVYVAGTTVPEAPQDYSLACEGCVVGQHAGLTVAVAPTGTGTVTGTGIACEGDCWEAYDLNATVVLTANPAPGYALDFWTGCDSPSGDTCTMTMDVGATVTATFKAVATLDVVIAPVGSGSVSGTGIACPGDCTEAYDLNSTVVLTAAPEPGFAFDFWTGCDSPAGDTCTMTMDVNSTLTANFKEVRTLNVVVDPVNGGHVTGTGIACPGDCSEVFDLNTTVVLTATPTTQHEFVGWMGCDSVNGDQCTVTLDVDTIVTAQFATKIPAVSREGLILLILLTSLAGAWLLKRRV